MGNINRIKNKEERLRAARSVRDNVNALLKEGETTGRLKGQIKFSSLLKETCFFRLLFLFTIFLYTIMGFILPELHEVFFGRQRK